MYEFLDENQRYEDLNIYQKHKADWLEDEKDYASRTKRAYWMHLGKANSRELSKEKDLYDWDKGEIIKFIKYSPTKNPSSKPPMFTATNMYIAWACKRGFNYVGNPCDTMEVSDWFEVNELAKKESYQSLQKFYNFIAGLNCTNVDKAMITLLRYGATVDNVGTIKWEDIDRYNMILNIYTEDKVLRLPIDNLFIERMDMAKMCTTRVTTKLEQTYIDCGYIVKTVDISKWITIPSGKVYNLISEISKRNQINRISVPDLRNSRKYDILLEIYEENNEVSNYDVDEVLIMFDGYSSSIKRNTLKMEFELVTDIKLKIVGIEKKRRIKQLAEAEANSEIMVDEDGVILEEVSATQEDDTIIELDETLNVNND